MQNNKDKKIFVVRKYVVATSVIDAIKKEKKQAVDDCWVEDDAHKEYLREKIKKVNPVGFKK